MWRSAGKPFRFQITKLPSYDSAGLLSCEESSIDAVRFSTCDRSENWGQSMQNHSFYLLGILLCLTLTLSASPLQTKPLLAQTDPMQRVIELTNQIRMANGLSPLKRNDTLQQAAIFIVEDNASRNTLSHFDSLGRSIGQRLADFGYAYSLAAENLAAGYSSPEAVLDGWMNSSGHRANILRNGLCEIGAGYTYRSGTTYGHFWSQTFGCRWNTYPVVINGEAATTTSPTVSLYIYGAGWAEQMRLSNDSVNWTEWRPYTTNYAWTLAPGSGERTVFVQLRHGTTIYQSSDTIVLINSIPEASQPIRTYIPLVIR